MVGDPAAERPRSPLQRLTLEQDDPAQAWLSFGDRVRAELWGWVPQLLATMVLVVAPLGWAAMERRSPEATTLRLWVVLGVAQLVFWGGYSTLRWFRLQLKDRAVRRLAQARASVEALPLDDWSTLAGEPDGRLVSVVGWVSARRTLAYPIDGRPCVGLVLDCQTTLTEMVDDDRGRGLGNRRVPHRQPHEAIVEMSEDFDLVDEGGQTLPVQVAGARLLGWRNVDRLGDDKDEQGLLASMRLPLDVVPVGADVFALRDGDPVLIIGFKAAVVDPRIVSRREPPVRAGLVSQPPRPLFVCALRADRRPRGEPDTSADGHADGPPSP